METLRKHSKIDPRSSKTLAKKNRVHFSKEAIKGLPIPADEPVSFRAVYYDDKVPGLCVLVAPSGLKTFTLYRWVMGRPERLKLGRFPDMTVEQARTAAQEKNGAIARGENPAADRRAVRAEMTLQELFDSWLLLYAKANKRTWQDDVWLFDKYLHAWRLRKICTITKPEVVRLHQHLGVTKGKTIANRVIEWLCAAYNRAIKDWGYVGVNPAAAVSAFKEKKRSRFLDGNELPAFFRALAEEPNTTVRDFFFVALLTGARRSNVETMNWNQINWQRATWTIPAEASKSGEEMVLVLVPMALQILQTRKKASASDWVFPGIGKTGHLVEPKSAWKRICKRAKLANVRMHDLRRTLGSWQAATGASLPVIGKSLGHSSVEATKVYARLQLDPIRESVEKATNAMLLTGKIAGLLPS